VSNLILPAHIGDKRYGKRAAPQGIEDPNNAERPLMYEQEVEGRLVIVANAPELSWRIPIDELKAMAQEQAKKRVKRGDAQKFLDWSAVIREYDADRRNAAWDRRNGRVSVGPATFAGNVRRKAAK
jgi:hypothetical protein